jgi:F-type H+-transporting ATPase subunit a
VGTLFLFILLSNVLSVVPYFMPPTGSLSTTTAFALLVFAAVPSFGLSTRSLGNYLSEYIKPTPFMLPFNILGEITRTFALAVRLYGNVMSGTVIGIVLLIVMPIFFPVIMQALGLLTGVIQAYIFALLAMVYIASALQKKDDQNLTN